MKHDDESCCPKGTEAGILHSSRHGGSSSNTRTLGWSVHAREHARSLPVTSSTTAQPDHTLPRSMSVSPEHRPKLPHSQFIASPLRLSARKAFDTRMDGPIDCLTLGDLGYDRMDMASDSSFACTEPFPLLSSAATRAIRHEMIPDGGCDQQHDIKAKWLDELWDSEQFSNLINRVVDVPVVVRQTRVGASAASALFRPGLPPLTASESWISSVDTVASVDAASSCASVDANYDSPDAAAPVVDGGGPDRAALRNKGGWRTEAAPFSCLVVINDAASPMRLEVQRKDGSVHQCCFPQGAEGNAVMLRGGGIPYRFCANAPCVIMSILLEPADGWAHDAEDAHDDDVSWTDSVEPRAQGAVRGLSPHIRSLECPLLLPSAYSIGRSGFGVWEEEAVFDLDLG